MNSPPAMNITTSTTSAMNIKTCSMYFKICKVLVQSCFNSDDGWYSGNLIVKIKWTSPQWIRFHCADVPNIWIVWIRIHWTDWPWFSSSHGTWLNNPVAMFFTFKILNVRFFINLKVQTKANQQKHQNHLFLNSRT